MRINLSEYNEYTFPERTQKQIIYRLIMQLCYYIKAPINELNTELPELKALESNAWFLTSYKASYKINDIMEILSVLHEEQKNKPSRFDLIEDEESLFWEMLMLFKEKIIKIKL